MLPTDNVSFHENLSAFCPDCGNEHIKFNDEPFIAGDMVVVVMVCEGCGWGFTLNITINGLARSEGE